jgi:NAD(P)-dependent dehydrogenase (short-subunit alcohol dehydrogenase family)
MTLSKNSVAVVTGAASGIGRALAIRLAQEGIAGIAISDVNENGLNETCEIISQTGVTSLMWETASKCESSPRMF